MCHGFHIMIHRSESLLFVRPPATHTCFVQIVSQAQQIFFCHLDRRHSEWISWSSGRHHSLMSVFVLCTGRSLLWVGMRSCWILALWNFRQHSWKLEVCASSSWCIVISWSFLTPRDILNSCGCWSLVWVEPFLCQSLTYVFVKFNSWYCAGRTWSFAFILTSLHIDESLQHGRDRPVSRTFVSLSSLSIITSSCQSLYSTLTSTAHPPPARGNSSSSTPAPTRTIPPTETKQLTKCNDETMKVTNRTLSVSSKSNNARFTSTHFSWKWTLNVSLHQRSISAQLDRQDKTALAERVSFDAPFSAIQLSGAEWSYSWWTTFWRVFECRRSFFAVTSRCLDSLSRIYDEVKFSFPERPSVRRQKIRYDIYHRVTSVIWFASYDGNVICLTMSMILRPISRWYINCMCFPARRPQYDHQYLTFVTWIVFVHIL